MAGKAAGPVENTLYIFVPGDTVEYEDYHNFENALSFYEADGLIIGSVLPIQES